MTALRQGPSDEDSYYSTRTFTGDEDTASFYSTGTVTSSGDMAADDDTASFYSSRTVTSDTDLDSCSRVSVDTITGRDVSDEEEDFSDKETTVMEDNLLPDQKRYVCAQDLKNVSSCHQLRSVNF